MNWYLNEISIQDQFRMATDFSAVLTKIYLATRRSSLRNTFFISRLALTRRATADLTALECIQRIESHDLRRQIFEWLSRSGPFLDDELPDTSDQIFLHGDLEVQDLALGCAARQLSLGVAAGTFSISGGVISFDYSPLIVNQGLPGEFSATFEVLNVWTVDELVKVAEDAILFPTSWVNFLAYAGERFDVLWISPQLQDQLARETFSPLVAQRALALMEILNAIASNRDPKTGSLNTVGEDLRKQHLEGGRFSDESTTNKNRFEKELTFRDPEDLASKIRCSWHGKIQTPQFRLYFEWPIPLGKTRLKIVYLGPKICKD